MIKRITIICFIILIMCRPVFAAEIQPPTAPITVQEIMPEEQNSFAEGLLWVAKQAIKSAYPSLTEAIKLCSCIIAIIMLVSIVNMIPGASQLAINLSGVLAISILLLNPSKTLIHLGIDTVKQLQEYSKLFLPVMTTALAMQGGSAGAAALYAGTAFFNTVLGTAISSLVVPLIYVYLCLCIACSAFADTSLDKLKGFVKWLITWMLKIVLYVFTGYMSITGVVSGTTDAAALKAAKLTISGVVPVVGNILSDASEAVLVSAGVMKQAAGVYGLWVFIALWISPFIKIGIQYILLKLTASVCDVFGNKQVVKLVHDFSDSLAMVVAMSGTVCLLSLISTVCFMKGMNV